MVVILPQAQYVDWLDTPPERSMAFMNQFPEECIVMTAEPQPAKATK